jgi:hypothetical protein
MMSCTAATPSIMPTPAPSSRGIGDINTLTVREYLSLSWCRRQNAPRPLACVAVVYVLAMGLSAEHTQFAALPAHALETAMVSTLRLYIDASCAITVMVVVGIISGFATAACLPDRTRRAQQGGRPVRAAHASCYA